MRPEPPAPIPSTTRALVSRLARGSLVYGGSDALQRLLSFALIAVYTRHLSTADYGIVGVLTAGTSVLAVLFGLGLRSAVVRQYYDWRHDGRELASLVGTALWLVCGGGALVALAGSLFGKPLFEALFAELPFTPYVPLALATSVFMAASGVLLSLYRAREQALRYAVLQLGTFVAASAAIVWLVVVRGEGASGYARGLALGWSLLFAVQLVLARREASVRFDASKARAALGYSLPLLPHLLASSVLLAVDRIVLERMTSLSQVGIYTLGYQIGAIVGQLAAAINAAWTPIFFDTANADGAGRSFARVFTAYAAGLALVAGTLALFAREIVLVLATDAYLEAAQIVPIVAAAYLCQGLYFLWSTPVFHARQTRRIGLVSVVAAVANVGLVVALVQSFGIVGAACATLISQAALAAGTFALARGLLPIPYELGKLALVFAVFAAVLALAVLR